MRRMRFLPKTIIVYFGKKTGFDDKNHHLYNKLPNF